MHWLKSYALSRYPLQHSDLLKVFFKKFLKPQLNRLNTTTLIITVEIWFLLLIKMTFSIAFKINKHQEEYLTSLIPIRVIKDIFDVTFSFLPSTSGKQDQESI